MQFSIFGDDEAVAVGGEAARNDYRLERNLARAAEFLVAFDISRRGWTVFTVGESLRYDLIADIEGLRRIQVKMNRRASYRGQTSKSLSYTFGKHDNKPLSSYAGDADLLALVALDRQVVLYVDPQQVKRAALHLSAGVFTPERSDLSWCEISRIWGLKGAG